MRYAFARRSSLSVVSYAALAGLVLSVAVLVLVVSVINGFDRELRQRLLGVLPHVTFIGRAPLQADAETQRLLRQAPQFSGVSPFVHGAVLLAAQNRVTGAMLTGIDPGSYSAVSNLADYMNGGDLAVLEGPGFAAIVGDKLARQLDLQVGDDAVVVLPNAAVTPGGLFARQKRVRVAAIVNTQSSLDTQALYLHIDDARKLYRLGGRIHGYQTRLTDLFDTRAAIIAGREVLGIGRVSGRSWLRTHGNLAQAIATTKLTMFVLLSFLVGVAAFNLVSSLVMIVDQRKADAAILQTLGAAPATLVAVFSVVGVLIGGLGAALGIGIGAGLALVLPPFYAWVTSAFDLELMSQYFINYLPVELQLADVVGIAITAFVLSVLATVYPARRAGRTRPSVVLAHE